MTKKPTTFALRGAVCFSTDSSHLTYLEDAYIVCQNGRTAGVFTELPEQFHGIPCQDFSNCLIIPGMNDLHLHAPQYAFHGMYMDLELLEWLNTVTFPEEARYSDLNYAEKAYSIFADDLKKSATTRASIFGTLHVDATELLMDLMEKTGLKAFIGKVNMDRNGSKALQEESAVVSATDTVRWLNDIAGKYENVKPILTPRFTPSCSDELMSRLAEIQRAYCLPVQSHLSENKSEIAWVKELCPNTSFYGEAYDQFGLFGGKTCPTIMAHCVYSSDAELSLMKDRGVFIAHCPIPIAHLVSLRSGGILKRDFTSDSVPTLPAATLFPCYERSQMPFRYPNFAGGLWMIPKNLFHWKKPFIWLLWVEDPFSEKSELSRKTMSLMR